MVSTANLELYDATLLDQSKDLQGLTAKQEAFAQAVVIEGLNHTEAYRKAYPNQCSDRTAQRIAADIASTPRVLARMQQLRKEIEVNNTFVPTVTRQLVINGILEIAQNKLAKNSDRLKAYELLGKSVGVDLFRDVDQGATRPRDLANIDKLLRDKLTQVLDQLSGNNAKDITPPKKG